MSIKALISCLVIFALGVAVGMATNTSAWRAATPSPSPRLWEKLQTLTDNDLEEYYRLQTAEEKALKADDILGKIMQIFLADLGLHASQHAREAAMQRLVPSATPSAPLKEGKPAEKVLITLPKSDPPPAPLKSERWQKAESELADVRDERSVSAFLARTRIGNLDEALKSTTRFSNRTETASLLNGTFAGRGNVSFGNQVHLWDLKIALNGGMSEGELKGNLLIELSEREEVLARVKDSGSLHSLREFAGGSEAVMVQAGHLVYLQVYYVKELDQLAGNIYRRDSEDHPFSYVGSVALKRL